MSSPGPAQIPSHVAIIMDGNGRWARQRGLPRIEGHRRGVETVRTDHRRRPRARPAHPHALRLFGRKLETPAGRGRRPHGPAGVLPEEGAQTFIKNRIRLRTIGRTQDLPAGVQKHLNAHHRGETAHFTDYTLVLALNYGARTEVADAARDYATAVAAGAKRPAKARGPPSAATFIPPTCPTPTSSSAPRARRASATSSCSRAPTPSSCSPRPLARFRQGRPGRRHRRILPAASAASA
jgi:undecaprenyl pyrophosphate synthase